MAEDAQAMEPVKIVEEMRKEPPFSKTGRYMYSAETRSKHMTKHNRDAQPATPLSISAPKALWYIYIYVVIHGPTYIFTEIRQAPERPLLAVAS